MAMMRLSVRKSFSQVSECPTKDCHNDMEMPPSESSSQGESLMDQSFMNKRVIYQLKDKMQQTQHKSEDFKGCWGQHVCKWVTPNSGGELQQIKLNTSGGSTQAIYPAKCQMKQSLTSGPAISPKSLVSLLPYFLKVFSISRICERNSANVIFSPLHQDTLNAQFHHHHHNAPLATPGPIRWQYCCKLREALEGKCLWLRYLFEPMAHILQNSWHDLRVQCLPYLIYFLVFPIQNNWIKFNSI